jgi:hypothetical protein
MPHGLMRSLDAKRNAAMRAPADGMVRIPIDASQQISYFLQRLGTLQVE